MVCHIGFIAETFVYSPCCVLVPALIYNYIDCTKMPGWKLISGIYNIRYKLIKLTFLMCCLMHN